MYLQFSEGIITFTVLIIVHLWQQLLKYIILYLQAILLQLRLFLLFYLNLNNILLFHNTKALNGKTNPESYLYNITE